MLAGEYATCSVLIFTVALILLRLSASLMAFLARLLPSHVNTDDAMSASTPYQGMIMTQAFPDALILSRCAETEGEASELLQEPDDIDEIMQLMSSGAAFLDACFSQMKRGFDSCRKGLINYSHAWYMPMLCLGMMIFSGFFFCTRL